jgi:CBS domain-containing protein
MTQTSISNIATPIEDYTHIKEDATLGEAFLALESALRGDQQTDPTRARDFAVLVIDAGGNVIGRLAPWDILRGLETHDIQGVDPLAMVDGLATWKKPLAHLATKAHNVLVRNLTPKLPAHELIDENAPLEQAIHQLLKHRAFSLIVTRDGKPVGVLRIVDVFRHVMEEARRTGDTLT